jgi:hypothetical protein
MLKVSFRHYGVSVLEIPLPCHNRVAIPKELEETAKVHLILEGEVVHKRRLWSTDSNFQLRMKQCREVVEGTFISETLVACTNTLVLSRIGLPILVAPVVYETRPKNMNFITFNTKFV